VLLVKVFEPIALAAVVVGLGGAALYLFVAAVTEVFKVAGWHLPWS
jgi:hypothetical protein